MFGPHYYDYYDYYDHYDYYNYYDYYVCSPVIVWEYWLAKLDVTLRYLYTRYPYCPGVSMV